MAGFQVTAEDDQEDRQVLKVTYLNPSAIKILGIFNLPGIHPITIEENEQVIGSSHSTMSCSGYNDFDFTIQ
jgi:hypothetical protein